MAEITAEQHLRTAVDAGDYEGAITALKEYSRSFARERRTLAELTAGRELIVWALRATLAGRARMAAQSEFLAGSEDRCEAAVEHVCACDV